MKRRPFRFSVTSHEAATAGANRGTDTRACLPAASTRAGLGIAELWDGCDAALSSRLSYPEVCAALAAAGRNHDLDDAGVTTALQDLHEYWAAMRTVELTPQVERDAGELAQRHALSGADAVHLASALAVDTPDLVVAVWDRRLHAGAVAEG